MPTKQVQVKPPPMVNIPSKCLIEILEPLVKILRIIGIPLDHSSIEPPIFRYWSICLGLLVYLCNLLANLYILVNELIFKSEALTTSRWNTIIHVSNLATTLIIIHGGLLICTVPNWKELVNVLRRIDQLEIFKNEDYEKFKRTLSRGSIMAILIVE